MNISQTNEIELSIHITRCTSERLFISSSNRSTSLIQFQEFIFRAHGGMAQASVFRVFGCIIKYIMQHKLANRDVSTVLYVRLFYNSN
jgi:hypothetical protein